MESPIAFNIQLAYPCASWIGLAFHQHACSLLIPTIRRNPEVSFVKHFIEGSAVERGDCLVDVVNMTVYVAHEECLGRAIDYVMHCLREICHYLLICMDNHVNVSEYIARGIRLPCFVFGILPDGHQEMVAMLHDAPIDQSRCMPFASIYECAEHDPVYRMFTTPRSMPSDRVYYAPDGTWKDADVEVRQPEPAAPPVMSDEDWPSLDSAKSIKTSKNTTGGNKATCKEPQPAETCRGSRYVPAPPTISDYLVNTMERCK
jgi:hypothetical protein